MIRQQRRAVKETARGSGAELGAAEFKKLRQAVREVMEDLEHEGLIYDTGLRRKGQIVYAATPQRKERN